MARNPVSLPSSPDRRLIISIIRHFFMVLYKAVNNAHLGLRGKTNNRPTPFLPNCKGIILFFTKSALVEWSFQPS